MKETHRKVTLEKDNSGQIENCRLPKTCLLQCRKTRRPKVRPGTKIPLSSIQSIPAGGKTDEKTSMQKDDRSRDRAKTMAVIPTAAKPSTSRKRTTATLHAKERALKIERKKRWFEAKIVAIYKRKGNLTQLYRLLGFHQNFWQKAQERRRSPLTPEPQEKRGTGTLV